MNLNYTEMGDPKAPALITMHGLLGSSRNWKGVGRLLAEHFRVIGLDARNHGRSFHTATHTFDDMVQDLEELMDHLGLNTATLMGHSMGGKVGMIFACRYPERVDRLFVVDSAPKDYPAFHDVEFAAMNALDLSKLKSRNDADALMTEYIDDWAFRQFLISNIVRGEDGAFKWTINLPVIEAHLKVLALNALDLADTFDGGTHFLVGGLSHFVDPGDFNDIRFHFPKVTIDVWDDSGHNLHFEHRDRFVEWVLNKVEG
ncbi:MAG: alpha/beta fold hydrolase [Verrucomicrobia bacterium]|nr:alpha/beta fold hydrolase [Verrucomicrobiota bacterium]